MIKERMIHIRVTDKEHKLIHQYANDKRLKLSKFARSVLINETAGGLMIAEELLKLRQEISKIGNNLNQLARRSNSGEVVNVSKSLSELKDIQNLINKKLEKVR